MRQILILVAVIATVYGQEICCAPEVYEISLAVIGEIYRDHFRDPYIESYQVAFDHTRQIRGAEVELQHLSDDSTERFRLVEDFKQDVYWQIREDKCTKYSLGNATLHRCTPPDAKFVESAYAGDHQVQIDRWVHDRADGGRKGVESLSYTRGNCVPLEISFRGEKINPDDKTTEGWSYSGGYVNFQKGIRDPERFFNLPSNCPK